MKIGYMANAWGETSGTGAGVTSIKDLLYTSAALDPQVFAQIKKAGFDFLEIFEGNLRSFGKNFSSILAENGLELLSVYTGGNLIFPEILNEELWKITRTCEAAAVAGARYITVGGGAVRHDGVREDDFKVLAESLDRIGEIARGYGLCACYHPHLGTIVERKREIDKVLSLCSIAFCPDCGHIQAAGSDAAEVIQAHLHRVRYVHLKDSRGGGFVPLGKGDVNFSRIFSLLASSGGAIDCTVEAERIPDPFGRAQAARAYLNDKFPNSES